MAVVLESSLGFEALEKGLIDSLKAFYQRAFDEGEEEPFGSLTITINGAPNHPSTTAQLKILAREAGTVPNAYLVLTYDLNRCHESCI